MNRATDYRSRSFPPRPSFERGLFEHQWWRRSVYDLAQGKAGLDAGHMWQSRKLGFVNSLEILDIACHHQDEIVLRSGHQEAPKHGRAVADRGFECPETIFALTFQADLDDHCVARPSPLSPTADFLKNSEPLNSKRLIRSLVCRSQI